MARKGLIESNHRKKKMVQRDRLKRSSLKKIIHDRSIPLEDRFNHVLKLSKMPRNGSLVRVRGRCALTGRSRGVYRFFALSRIKFRELALTGDLPGVRKSSW
ncbi:MULTISPECIES: 30S ribosomal protein S14 [Holospora]|uniref:Small ribosomal subunit protein uS14 n=2 Tax=Holospora TaxID=44747 RepID=A0A061JG11_9PROT|nr:MULTISPECIES: 30S ribosomal protein S14 [Holospora]ETZ04766.1 30S ribosomal protein S14 [Holospora undulata HU1]GAJ46030.1 30S ribosomal protein S14 [Holospora elegans E1]